MEVSKQAEQMSEDNSLEPEVNQAYIEIVGAEYATADQAEEAYVGKFDSDKDFAQEQAEAMGVDTASSTWPHYCLDWEYAARELMMDYSEEGGHYFRNL